MIEAKAQKAAEKVPEDKVLREIICENLKQMRKHAGYSQQELAELLGITRSAYTYYELGTTQPSLRSLYVLSRVYGKPMETFFK